MSRAPSWFDQFGQDPQARIDHGDRAFERDRVAFVMKTLGCGPKKLKDLRAAGRDMAGQPDLYFDCFNAMFPEFPFALGASTLRHLPLPYKTRGEQTKTTSPDYTVHRDYHSLEPMRYKAFEQVPFVVAYGKMSDRLQEVAVGRSVGLVFPRRGIIQGLMIHDDINHRYWTEGFAQVFKYRDDGGTEFQLIVQRFSDVIKAIAAEPGNWRD